MGPGLKGAVSGRWLDSAFLVLLKVVLCHGGFSACGSKGRVKPGRVFGLWNASFPMF